MVHERIIRTLHELLDVDRLELLGNQARSATRDHVVIAGRDDPGVELFIEAYQALDHRLCKSVKIPHDVFER